MHSKKYRIVQLFIFLISILIFFVHAQAKEVILDCVDVKEIQCIALELKQINKCSFCGRSEREVEMDVPKARILHTQICKNIPMRAYYFDQKTHRRVSTSF